MSCLIIKDFLESTYSSHFKCTDMGTFLAIETPFYYPDGDVIEIFLHEKLDKIVISDMGETIRFLGSYDLEIKSYSKRQHIIDDVTNLLKVNFFKNVLYKRLNSMDELAEGIFDLCQSIIRICDLLYTVRGSSPAAFVEDVKDFLDFNKFKFEENYTVETKSSNKYEFDLGVEVENKIKLVKLVTPPSKPTHTPNLDRILRIWVDIDNYSDYQISSRITLLDDTTYHWKENPTLLIKKFSSVIHWSDKEKFLNTLRTA